MIANNVSVFCQVFLQEYIHGQEYFKILWSLFILFSFKNWILRIQIENRNRRWKLQANLVFGLLLIALHQSAYLASPSHIPGSWFRIVCLIFIYFFAYTGFICGFLEITYFKRDELHYIEDFRYQCPQLIGLVLISAYSLSSGAFEYTVTIISLYFFSVAEFHLIKDRMEKLRTTMTFDTDDMSWDMQNVDQLALKSDPNLAEEAMKSGHFKLGLITPPHEAGSTDSDISLREYFGITTQISEAVPSTKTESISTESTINPPRTHT